MWLINLLKSSVFKAVLTNSHKHFASHTNNRLCVRCTTAFKHGNTYCFHLSLCNKWCSYICTHFHVSLIKSSWLGSSWVYFLYSSERMLRTQRTNYEYCNHFSDSSIKLHVWCRDPEKHVVSACKRYY